MFEPTMKSIKSHQPPDWYHDAKLGIFIHWGLYSIPAYAPVEFGDINDTVVEHGWEFHFAHNPYAEWYWNSIKIKDSPHYQFHLEHYGREFHYENFAPKFNETVKAWDPEAWAELFKTINARYVVLGAKHHDGFCLWPSDVKNPRRQDFFSERNLVGELTDAVKKRGMKMGLYYSGALDWTFNRNPITDMASMVNNGPLDADYAEYVFDQYMELIKKFHPSILWNDIGYPPDARLEELIAYFYNNTDDGVINDRWSIISERMRKAMNIGVVQKIVEWISRKFLNIGAGAPVSGPYDYKTPEYAHYKKIKKEKWESCRGIANSFGYNKLETDDMYISVRDLIHMFVDIVSKNGNLLINIGPRADGSIPEAQVDRLLGLGRWLNINGEAIFNTRPWERAEGQTKSGAQVRYTKKDDYLYMIILSEPDGDRITIPDILIRNHTSIFLLGNSKPLSWKKDGDVLTITLPDEVESKHAYSFRIDPIPN